MTDQKNTPPQLMVLAQYIKDLSFENPNAPSSFTSGEQSNLNMHFDLGADQVGDDAYEVNLNFVIEALEKDKKAFVLEIKYAGLFRINETNKDLLEQILLIQCPTILFPYVRQIIADTSSRGGYPPVNVNPIDFYSFYVTKKQEQMKSDGTSPTNENAKDKKSKSIKSTKNKTKH